MNALSLSHDLKARGVILAASPDGEHLKVNAPTGVVTEEDKAALSEFKPALLKLLSGEGTAEDGGDGRYFKTRRSKYPGYTSLYDPVHDEWHDFPTKDCFPSIVAEAREQKKGGAA